MELSFKTYKSFGFLQVISSRLFTDFTHIFKFLRSTIQTTMIHLSLTKPPTQSILIYPIQRVQDSKRSNADPNCRSKEWSQRSESDSRVKKLDLNSQRQLSSSRLTLSCMTFTSFSSPESAIEVFASQDVIDCLFVIQSIQSIEMGKSRD